jgi:hypothetical protein
MAGPGATVPTYTHSMALSDLPAIKHAAALFLNSKMIESEAYCNEYDPKRSVDGRVARRGWLMCNIESVFTSQLATA